MRKNEESKDISDIFQAILALIIFGLMLVAFGFGLTVEAQPINARGLVVTGVFIVVFGCVVKLMVRKVFEIVYKKKDKES